MANNLYDQMQSGQSPEDYANAATPYPDQGDQGQPMDLSQLPPDADPCNPDDPYYSDDLCQQLAQLQAEQEGQQNYGDQGYGDQGDYVNQPPPPSYGPSAAPSAPSAPMAPSMAPSMAPMASPDYSQPPYPAAPGGGTAVSPSGGSYSTTPTPYTDAQGNPTDAYGNPSDAYGNPIDPNTGAPMDSNGQDLPTDANGNAAAPGAPSSAPNQNLQPATPGTSPGTGPVASSAPCDSLIFPVPSNQIPTGEIQRGDTASVQAQRQMRYDQQGNLGTVGIIPMAAPAGGLAPKYAIVAFNFLVQDPNTGLLSYLAFPDLNGVAARIMSQSYDDVSQWIDDPNTIAAIRANCPGILDYQDIVNQGYFNPNDPNNSSGDPTAPFAAVDISQIPIWGWTWQPVDAQGNLVDANGNPVDEYGNPIDDGTMAGWIQEHYDLEGEDDTYQIIGDYIIGAPLRRGPSTAARGTSSSRGKTAAKGLTKGKTKSKSKKKVQAPQFTQGVKVSRTKKFKGFLKKMSAAQRAALGKKNLSKQASQSILDKRKALGQARMRQQLATKSLINSRLAAARGSANLAMSRVKPSSLPSVTPLRAVTSLRQSTAAIKTKRR